MKEYLEKLKELLVGWRTVKNYEPPMPPKHVIVIDQGGNPKDGKLWIDGEEVTFLRKMSIDLDMRSSMTKMRIERVLPANERINAVLHDVDVQIKSICPHCGSEMIEKIEGNPDMPKLQPIDSRNR